MRSPSPSSPSISPLYCRGRSFARFHSPRSSVDLSEDNIGAHPSFQSRSRQNHLSLRDHGTEEELLESLCHDGKLEDALGILFWLSVSPSDNSYISILSLCSSTKSLRWAMLVYSHAVENKDKLSALFNDYVVATLAKCGAIEDAYRSARKLVCSTVFSCTAIISAYSESGMGQEALRMHQKMDEEGIQPNNYTFVSLFKTCGTIRNIHEGRKLHTEVCKKGLEYDTFIGNTLVSMYGKCSAIADAEGVFYKLSKRDIVSWNAMFSAYVYQNEGSKALLLYRQLHEEGTIPDKHTFVCALHACGVVLEEESLLKAHVLDIGRAFHADARKKGYVADPSIANSLVYMYGKCGVPVQAEEVFSNLSQRDVKPWTAMFAVYIEQLQGEKALKVYRQMLDEGINNDRHATVLAFQACDILESEKHESGISVSWGMHAIMKIREALHANARKSGHAYDLFVATTLINMYTKTGMIGNAENIFCTLSNHDVVLWTAILSAYVEQGEGKKVLQLYRHMQEEGVYPDQHVFVASLQACGLIADEETCPSLLTKSKSLDIGEALHADIRRMGYATNSYVTNALLAMYGKCGDILQVEALFNMLTQPDVVSWTVMLSAYAKQGQEAKALELYRQIRNEHVLLDDCIIFSIVQSCSEIGSIEVCNQLYFDALPGHYDRNLLVCASLIHGYGNCASMLDARGVFDTLPDPDVALWTACIAGYSGEGDCERSIRTLDEMMLTAIQPNKITLTSIVSACSHSGLVVVGLQYFNSMIRDYNLALDLTHYGSLLDLLGRAGDFKKLENVLKRLPHRSDMNIWFSLLSACRMHNNVRVGKQAFDHALHFDSEQTAAYDLMISIYANVSL